MPDINEAILTAIERLRDRLNNLKQVASIGVGPYSVNQPLYYAPTVSPSSPLSCIVTSGIVVDAAPQAGAYQVQLEIPNPAIWATATRMGSVGPTGAALHASYSVGDEVIVLLRPGRTTGVIIGAVPSTNNIIRIPQMISPISGLDFGLSPTMERLVKGRAPIWSCGAPSDSTTTGEAGAITELGGLVHVDPFMMCMRLNDATGLFMFLWDELVRLAGKNFQQWTGGHVMECLQDEGELLVYSGDAVYPWELLGLLNPAASPFKTINDSEMDLALWLAPREPVEVDQKTFHRIFSLRSYLGFGNKTYVVAPNPNVDVNKYSRETPDFGLVDATMSIGGVAGIQVAGSLTVMKSPFIVPPHRKKEANDPTGDHIGNYLPSGIGANEISPNLQWEAEDHRSLAAGMSGIDSGQYVLNKYSTTPVAEHKEDFFYPEQSEYVSEMFGTASAEYKPDYSTLKDGGALPLPPKTQIAIDHRQKADVYHSTAYMCILEDGTVCIGDGYGGEIRMCGGKIFIDAPGGIFLQSGREVVTFAGGDIVNTARGSVDITAKKDARMCAFGNLHMAGALDGGYHGVLIESRSDYDNPQWYKDKKQGEDITIGGLRLLCPNAKLTAYAKDIHAVAHGDSSSAGNVRVEATALNNDLPQGDVVLVGYNVFHNVDCAVFNCFTEDEKPRKNTPHQVFTATGVVIDATTLFNQDVVVYNNIHLGGSVVNKSADGRMFAEDGNVVRWKKAVLEEAEKTVDVRPNNRENEVPTNVFCFTVRTTDQYNTQYFIMPEARYSRIARNGASGMVEWEPAIKVESSVGETYTYPGKDAQMMEYKYGCFNLSVGMCENRSDVKAAGYNLTPTIKLHAVAGL